jgi:hypothetical protein
MINGEGDDALVLSALMQMPALEDLQVRVGVGCTRREGLAEWMWLQRFRSIG